MKIKDFPLGVEVKRYYTGGYRVRRTKDGTTLTFIATDFQEAINYVRHIKNLNKQEKREI